jgi:hypothetical protein
MRIDNSGDLSELLQPLREKLDAARWYLNGYGINFVSLLQEIGGLSPLGGLTTGTENELAEWLETNREWLKANEQQMSQAVEEYEHWMDDTAGYRVGLPGWFSRYVDYADTCWAGYVVCESANGERPKAALSAVRQSDPAWEQDPATFTFPEEVIFACKNVDDAWWDFYFRDEVDLRAVREHVECLEDCE